LNDAFSAASACAKRLKISWRRAGPVLLQIGDKTLTSVGRCDNRQARNGADLPRLLIRPEKWIVFRPADFTPSTSGRELG